MTARLTRGDAWTEPRSSVKCAAAIRVDESSECAKRLWTTGAIPGLLALRADSRHRWNQPKGPDSSWMPFRSRREMQQSQVTHSDDVESVRVRIESCMRGSHDPTAMAIRCEEQSE